MNLSRTYHIQEMLFMLCVGLESTIRQIVKKFQRSVSVDDPIAEKYSRSGSSN